MKPINSKQLMDQHISTATRPQASQAPEQSSMTVVSATQSDIIFTENSPIDKLQGTVYNEETRILSALKDAALLDATANVNLDKVRSALDELGHFSFNIGFAGEQSSGKSTVINSLLRYPLMPTCQTKTTAVVVQLAYSDHLRIRVRDEDTHKPVLDYDCQMPKNPSAQKVFRERFNQLLDYGVNAMHELVMETFQPFSDVNVLESFPSVSDMDMSPENPRHVMILLFVLLAVYVGQNDESWDEQTEELMNKRRKIFHMLGIPANTVNISIFAQADFEILKSGLVITDLPGLGSSASSRIINGKKVMGHDEITINAIKDTDAMVFLSTPENRDAGYQVLTEMLSNAKIKEAVYKGDRIIAVLNKADCLGEAQRVTTLRSFCTALAAVGVNKDPQDILCYSGIAGEFRFEDTPFERTLFFKENFDEKMLRARAERRGKNYEDLKAEKLEDMKDEAEAWYNASSIPELSHLFRTSYVEQGKYIKSTAALQALRIIVKKTVTELENMANSYELISNAHGSMQEKMIEMIQNAIESPIAEALSQFTKLRHRITEDVYEGVEEYSEHVPTLYIDAFSSGLSTYKDDLLNCMNDFDTRIWGLGDKARIDVPGSKNRNTYLTLMNKMQHVPISLKKVNAQYEKMLQMVRTKIDRFYEDALHHLSKLKFEINRSLNSVINEARREDFSEAEIDTLSLMKDQMLVYVEKQIDLVNEQCRQQQGANTEAMQNIVDAVLDLNQKMASEFASSTYTALTNRISSGGIFVSKEYILVDGSGGMKAAVQELQLTETEKEIIRLNLDSDVNSIVFGLIPCWIDDLNEMTAIFQTLQEELLTPLRGLSESMGHSAEANAEKAKQLRKKVKRWNDEVCKLNDTVCPVLKEACEYINDREPANINMQEDIFFGCFS